MTKITNEIAADVELLVEFASDSYRNSDIGISATLSTYEAAQRVEAFLATYRD